MTSASLDFSHGAWQINPSPPPAVRLGLGFCYEKLGQSGLAQASLERALELQPDFVDAMVGLAVLYLNEDQVLSAHVCNQRSCAPCTHVTHPLHRSTAPFCC